MSNRKKLSAPKVAVRAEQLITLLHDEEPLESLGLAPSLSTKLAVRNLGIVLDDLQSSESEAHIAERLDELEASGADKDLIIWELLNAVLYLHHDLGQADVDTAIFPPSRFLYSASPS